MHFVQISHQALIYGLDGERRRVNALGVRLRGGMSPSGAAFAPNRGPVWSALKPRLNVLFQEVFVSPGVVLRLKGLGGGWGGC